MSLIRAAILDREVIKDRQLIIKPQVTLITHELILHPHLIIITITDLVINHLFL